MFLGLDYSYDWPRVAVSQLKPLGYEFVMRYLCYSRVNSAGNDASKKRLLPGEVATLRQNGLLIGLNWEYEIGDQWGGAPAGQNHALEAVSQAKALGAPEGTAIYFSTDFQASSAHFSSIDAYFNAAKPIVHGNGYRLGQYGQYSVIRRAFDLSLIDVGWQTYAWSLKSQNVAGPHSVTVNVLGADRLYDTRAALRQVHNGLSVAGGNVDKDECHREPYFWDYC